MNLQRHSYASIEFKKHKLLNDCEFDFSNSSLIANEFDKSIVKDLLTEIEKNELDENKGGTGEWLWLQDNKQNDFIGKITLRDIDQISNKLISMFRNDATYGYLSPSFNDVGSDPDMVKSDILNNIDTCIEFTDITDIADLATPTTIGAPFGLVADGGVVLPDTPRHYYYAMKIKKK